jgi:hypothetical protein
MAKDWVRIFESPDEMNVAIAQQKLEEHNIESVIVNKKDRSYLFGELELFVNRDRVIEAKSVIKDFLI